MQNTMESMVEEDISEMENELEDDEDIVWTQGAGNIRKSTSREAGSTCKPHMRRICCCGASN